MQIYMQELAQSEAVDGMMFVSHKQISFVVFRGADPGKEKKDDGKRERGKKRGKGKLRCELIRFTCNAGSCYMLNTKDCVP